MITLQEFMEAIQYKVTDGSNYQWDCYGPDVRCMDSETGDYSIICMFSSTTQEVFELQAWDFIENRFYRWIDPNYIDLFKNEAEERGVDVDTADGNNKFFDLEIEEDILEKVTAIVAGKEYDNRMMITLDLPHEDLFILMQMAHEKDVTFNELVNNIFRDNIKGTK